MSTKIENTAKEPNNEFDAINEAPPSDIVAYNELRSCADLLRMEEEGSLLIRPFFQRDFVWPSQDQTRFIDSLTKQLPIPSMCFANDFKKNQWIVIDGLQRISTIIRFLSGADWKLSSLSDIDPALKGKSAAAFASAKSGDMKILYSRVKNQTIPINVLRCDFSKRNHNEYIFTIFHRLNSGGLKLNNQEIRNCIFSGALNEALKELDSVPAWRAINNMQPEQNYRFTKQEAILRFFAFSEEHAKYKGSVTKFLNDYMFDHRTDAASDIDARKEIFSRTVRVISEKIITDRPAPDLPGTVFEALMIGVAANIDRSEQESADILQARFEKLRSSESFSAAALAEGLSKKDKVKERIATAKTCFSE